MASRIAPRSARTGLSSGGRSLNASKTSGSNSSHRTTSSLVGK